MTTYYNENDPHAAQWLCNLMAAGLIPDGHVDERSIADVRPKDLAGFRQHHFFAGLAGWALALQLAGWGDRPVWTGSCPCQPFSSAGRRRGAKDDRHLWPVWFRLIRECRPDLVISEQVASAIGHGWLDGVCADLEGEGYAVGAAILGAHSSGAPHIRQRLFWVADRDGGRRQVDAQQLGQSADDSADRDSRRAYAGGRGRHGRLGDARAPGLPASEREAVRGPRGRQEGRAAAESGRALGGVADGAGQRRRRTGRAGEANDRAKTQPDRRGDAGAWGDYALIPCADGKARRVESGLQCLVDGVPFRLADGRTREGVSRVQVLRGIGNAIVPQTAALFVRAFLDAEGDSR